MGVNPDFRDLFAALNEAGARYLVVGAYAVMHHSEPRYTKDLDIWVDATPENAERVFAALRTFRAPLAGLKPADFADTSSFFKMGKEPNRVDIIMGLAGPRFETAWRNRVSTTYGELPIHVLGYQELIRAKLAAGRPMDLIDVDQLRVARRVRKRKPAARRKRPKK